MAGAALASTFAAAGGKYPPRTTTQSDGVKQLKHTVLSLRDVLVTLMLAVSEGGGVGVVRQKGTTSLKDKDLLSTAELR